MTRLLQDIRFGLRSFVRAPGFTAVAVVVLGLGIGANSAIFTIVNLFMFKPLAGRAGELVGLYSHDRNRPDSYRSFSYPNYVDIREQSGVFDGLLAHTFAMVGVPEDDGTGAPRSAIATKRTFVELISSNYFETLGVPLAAGRPFTLAEERPSAHITVAIVSYAFWQLRGADPALLGSRIRINAEDFTIVGITPRGFTGTVALIAPDVYLPLGMFDTIVNDLFKNKGTGLSDRSNAGLVLAGSVKAGLTDAAVAARLDALSRNMSAAYPAENKDQILTVNRLSRLGVSTSPHGDAGLTAFSGLLLGLSGVVLLIASLNLANMLLARGATRRKEIAVRLALGAKRSRVVRQLLTESVLLALPGAVLGLLLSYWTTRGLSVSLSAVMPLGLWIDPRPDAAIVAVTTAFAVMSTMVFGLGPALKLSRRDLVTDLKEAAAEGPTLGRWFSPRNLMVIGQVAMSLALLVSGGIFARVAIEASRTNPGYSYDRLLVASLDPSLAGMSEAQGRGIYRNVLERLRRLPFVRAAGMASTVPFGDMHEGQDVERVGAATPRDAGHVRTFRIIGADYFAALALSMKRGREFTRTEEESASAPAVAIVDENLAQRLFGGEDPIGQTIRIPKRPESNQSADDTPMQVVGISPSTREELLDRTPGSHIYVPFGRNYRANMHVCVKLAPGANAGSSLDALRRELQATDARLPVLTLSTMQTFHDRSLELWALEAGGRLFTALGLLALTLAVVGVYGVKSYVVSQRTREIGIRMALGASAGDVVRLVLRDGLILTGAGLAIGLPLALLVSLLFAQVFVDIGGVDMLVVSVATAALGLAAMAATLVPARRAATITPLSALRSE